jgi:Tol biopolymer transport system component
MIYRILLVLVILFSYFPIISKAVATHRAVFLRNDQLWIKEGEQELQLTQNRYVYSPKWSYDGRFIAYIDRDDKGGKTELFIYDSKKKEHFQPYEKVETSNFKWSPVKNQLAYTSGGVLNVTKEKNDRPQGFENVALGVSDFEWFPNGKEFIVSSQANLLPTGWGPFNLYNIPADANLKADKMKLFYTIETNEPDFFAISADYFKWSPDGKWLSFLAVPTASWSNDSNTLCVLSSNGEQFQSLGKMLWYQDWMKWAPSANQLAYISGEGRFFVENKKMTIAEMPATVQQKEYTPKGYVDLDLEWVSSEKVIVARAKENKQWQEGPVPAILTALYSINIRTGEQEQITFPKKNELDADPQMIDTTLSWFRMKERYQPGDVWVKEGIDGKEKIWIKNVDEAPVFFTK